MRKFAFEHNNTWALQATVYPPEKTLNTGVKWNAEMRVWTQKYLSLQLESCVPYTHPKKLSTLNWSEVERENARLNTTIRELARCIPFTHLKKLSNQHCCEKACVCPWWRWTLHPTRPPRPSRLYGIPPPNRAGRRMCVTRPRTISFGAARLQRRTRRISTRTRATLAAPGETGPSRFVCPHKEERK